MSLSRSTSWLRHAALVALVSGAPAAAQPGCDASTASTWLRQPASLPAGPTVDATLVHPVVNALPRAVALLRTRAALRLTPDEMVEFTGRGAIVPELQDRHLRPYLVRAVYPTPNAQIEVRWSGTGLHVLASGLGCAAFSDHPIVVYLGRRPTQISVTVSAAL